ncbi:hypothetical protein HDU96_002188, partial [Phlyctochytrium bullatum]
MDACKRLGFTFLQKVTAALRMLTSGQSAHEMDNRFWMAALLNLQQFCETVIRVFREQTLSPPTPMQIHRLLSQRGGQ